MKEILAGLFLTGFLDDLPALGQLILPDAPHIYYWFS